MSNRGPDLSNLVFGLGCRGRSISLTDPIHLGVQKKRSESFRHGRRRGLCEPSSD